ncbi:MAG: (2Fe-2S)-binding protein [Marinomonadaceae bacterium]
MFNALYQTPDRKLVPVKLNDIDIFLPEGMTIAAALLQVGIRSTRNSKISGDSRAPYCMMGICYECLIEINGIPNQQSCMKEVVKGMTILTSQQSLNIEKGQCQRAEK